MSEIEIKKTDAFTLIPTEFIQNPNITYTAKMVAIYLLGKPEAQVCHPFEIKNIFKLGRHTWLKVSKELRELGVLELNHSNTGTRLLNRSQTLIKGGVSYVI